MTGTPSGVASMTPAQRSAILMPPNAGNAILHDRGALADGGIRDGRGRLLRLGAAVAWRVERRCPAPRRAGEEPIDLIRPSQAGVDLIGPSLREPCLAVRGLPLRLAEIDDAGLAKPRLRAHPCIHPLPQAHALDRQRHLGKLATHLAAPAPISARLPPAMVPFSQSTTGTPRSARKSVVEAPTIPPPISAGSSDVVWTGSARGAIKRLSYAWLTRSSFVRTPLYWKPASHRHDKLLRRCGEHPGCEAKDCGAPGRARGQACASYSLAMTASRCHCGAETRFLSAAPVSRMSTFPPLQFSSRSALAKGLA